MNNSVKIALVEDESYNMRLLEGMIKGLRPGWVVTGNFDSVGSTVEWLKKNPHPDLLFLDIQLADGNCFSIFNQVEVKSLVIFTTAYDNYAIRAFKVNSIDYLLKPFKESELEAAIVKYEKFVHLTGQLKGRTDYGELLNAIRDGAESYRKRLLVSKGSGFISLDVNEIAFFYSENRITTAITFNRNRHVIDFTLDTIDDQLDPDCFFRANRQLIVNIAAVKRVENYYGGKLKLQLSPQFEGNQIVSRLKSLPFRKWLGQ